MNCSQSLKSYFQWVIMIATLTGSWFLANEPLTRLRSVTISWTGNGNDPFIRGCEQLLQTVDIENLTIWGSQYVSAGTLLNLTVDEPMSDGDGSIKCSDPGWGTPIPLSAPVDMCRVSSEIRRSDRSKISLEMWLPRNWTGRLLSAGNGALGGCIQHEDLAWGNSLGFASVSGNGGHNGTRGFSFYKNEDSLEDFGWMSAHLGAVIGKELVSSFYGRPSTKSYYYGCSRGGGQGWKEAQAFPEDFDGILVGCAALRTADLMSWTAHFQQLVGSPQSKSFLPLSLWEIVHESVVEQCDGLDGAVDGLVEYPSVCPYDPEQLLCSKKNPNPARCLTKAQVETVRKVYADFYVGDTLIYPGMQPSGELEIVPWGTLSGEPHVTAQDYFRFAVKNDSSWDISSLTDEDIIDAQQRDPGSLQVWSGNLSSFAQRGSKILAYHGTHDGYIPSPIAGIYRNHVSQTMSLSSTEIDDFYRLFEIGGMGHCSGGPGAWYIGQPGFSPTISNTNQSALMALVKWVEEDVPPETILGTKYQDEEDFSAGILFQRAHCKYPLRNVFQGGDVKDFRNWKCV